MKNNRHFIIGFSGFHLIFIYQSYLYRKDKNVDFRGLEEVIYRGVQKVWRNMDVNRLWNVLRTKRFIKFCMVGLSGVVVNLGILWALTEILKIFYIISAAVSVETSIISNFLLNEFWTFGDQNASRTRGPFFTRLFKFNLISIIGLILNLLILAFLTEIVGFYYLLSEIVAIGVVAVWNYLANVTYTWRLGYAT